MSATALRTVQGQTEGDKAQGLFNSATTEIAHHKGGSHFSNETYREALKGLTQAYGDALNLVKNYPAFTHIDAGVTELLHEGLKALIQNENKRRASEESRALTQRIMNLFTALGTSENTARNIALLVREATKGENNPT